MRKGGRKSERLRERERQIKKEIEIRSRGVDLEVVTTIFGDDDDIGHGWVDLEGGGNEIEGGGRDELQGGGDENEMTRLRSRWQ